MKITVPFNHESNRSLRAKFTEKIEDNNKIWQKYLEEKI